MSLATRAFFAASALLLIACSGASSDPVTGPATTEGGTTTTTIGPRCETVVADACAPAFHVSTPAEVIGASKAFDYQRVSISQGTTLVYGDSLVADADIEVESSDLAPAGGCPECHAPLFRTEGFARPKAIAGISCIDPGTDRPVSRASAVCARVAIAKGTTFRLHAVIEDMHPSAPTYWAFIDFVEPCATTCGSGEVLCAASHACFAAGSQACSFCEGLAPNVCACRDEACGKKADGATCSFSKSPDLLVSGTCRAQGCVGP